MASEKNNVCLTVSKWSLIIFNVTFWLMGVVSLAVGLWLYVTSNEFATLSAGGRLVGAVLLVAVGFGTVIVGFLGIIAALWESRIMAIIFCLLMVLAVGMYLSSGVWSVVVKRDLGEAVEQDLLQSMELYDTVPAYGSVLDALQERYSCCGVNSAGDWSRLRPFLPGPPPSCCPSSMRNCANPFPQGCLDHLQNYERKQLNILGPLALAFGAFQLVGVAVCILFCCSLQSIKYSYPTTSSTSR